jgi:hypothetical protein
MSMPHRDNAQYASTINMHYHHGAAIKMAICDQSYFTIVLPVINLRINTTGQNFRRVKKIQPAVFRIFSRFAGSNSMSMIIYVATISPVARLIGRGVLQTACFCVQQG